MAADPVGSAIGLATGHVAGEGAAALNHAVGSPISDEKARLAGNLLGGYAGMKYMAAPARSFVSEAGTAY